MFVYLQQRLALAIPVVFGVSVVVFAIVHLLPGDPVLVMLSGANATPEQVAELRAPTPGSTDSPCSSPSAASPCRASGSACSSSFSSHSSSAGCPPRVRGAGAASCFPQPRLGWDMQ